MPPEAPPAPPETRPPDIPYGRCWCGCGRLTRIASRTNTALGVKRGEPVRYIAGHYARRPTVSCDRQGMTACPACKTPAHREDTKVCPSRHNILKGRGCTGCARVRNTTPRMNPHDAADEWDHFHGNLGWNTRQFADHFGYCTPEGMKKVMLELPARHPSRISYLAAWKTERAPIEQPGSFASPIGVPGATGERPRPGRPFALHGRRIA